MLGLIQYGMLHVWKYFGYDPVNDEYKVQNVFSDVDEFFEVSKRKYDRRVISETQVLVLGAGTSWRNTKSITSPPLPHCPHGQGISINCVLYYVASFSHEERNVVMSFDLNSEEFNWIEIPMEAEWHQGLMNYQDQVTFIDDSRLKTECILDLRVLEDAGKSKWSHKIFVLPYHELRLSISIDYLKIRGTGRRGEIWLCQSYANENEKNTLVVYNVEKNRMTRGLVIGPPCPLSWILNLWEDVENIIHLEA